MAQNQNVSACQPHVASHNPLQNIIFEEMEILDTAVLSSEIHLLMKHCSDLLPLLPQKDRSVKT